jgi:four helix bundle protein
MINNNQAPKSQVPNNLQNKNNQKFDLEDRTLSYSIKVINKLKEIPDRYLDTNIKKQLLRSATSIGANYIEANEALGKKDFIYRLRISRKEAKETIYWLILLKNNNQYFANDIDILISESREFIYIFSSIINKLV